jgi:hypothetical protein
MTEQQSNLADADQSGEKSRHDNSKAADTKFEEKDDTRDEI